MGMSIHIVGVRPKNEKYKEMEKIWNLCLENRISIPVEVEEFFNGERPGEDILVDLEKLASEHRSDTEDGFEIKVKDIPEGIESIRFFNSY